MTTSLSDDAISCLAEDIGSCINTVSELKNRWLYIYSPTQISSLSSGVVLPFVFFNYAGIQPDSKNHKIYFDLYFAAKSETLTQIKNNKVIPVATKILQSLRKSIGCKKSPTHHKWELSLELPDFTEDDVLIYQQRWFTNYQISN